MFLEPAHRLDATEILGRYPPEGDHQQLEFQIGGVLIWVLRPLSMSEETCVANANNLLPALLDAKAQIREFVERELNLGHMPKSLDSECIDAVQLLSLTIRLDGSSIYDLEIDRDEGVDAPLPAGGLPADSNDAFHVSVERAADGALSLRAR